MSINQMKIAFEDKELKPIEKLIMLSLADNANDSGICFPSWNSIQEKTSLSRGALASNLKNLEDKKYIIKKNRNRKNGSRTSNKYLLFPEINIKNLDEDDYIIFKESIIQSSGDELAPHIQSSGDELVYEPSLIIKPSLKKINKKEPHQTSSNTQNFNKDKYRIFDEEDFLPKEDIETIEVEVVELKEKPLEEKAIDYLNKLTGKKFSYTSGNTKEIKAQIKKGATEEQLKYVIDVKCNEWLNNAEMKKHLNPTTLFREANFNKYLNQDFDLSGVVMDEYIRQRCEEVQNANK